LASLYSVDELVPFQIELALRDQRELFGLDRFDFALDGSGFRGKPMFFVNELLLPCKQYRVLSALGTRLFSPVHDFCKDGRKLRKRDERLRYDL